MTVTPLADRPLSARALTDMLGDWRHDHKVTYLALAARIRLLVTEGRVLPGTRLPAERPLATALGLSRTTIVAAYGSLREDGFVVSAQGSGSVITHNRQPPAQPLPAAGIDFSMASPGALPDLPEMYGLALEQLPAALNHGGFDLVGLDALRVALAERYTLRGLATEPDEIVVTLGAQHAITLVARAVLSRGDRALVEAPTYPHAAEALAAAGGRLVSIPVYPEGWDIDQSVSTIQRTMPRLGYLMPDFHNPTGASMSTEARAAILAAAESCGTILIADETAGEFDFSGAPVAPFAAGATEDQRRRIVTIGSVGKTLWGGIRVGWIRANTALLRRVLAIRSYGDLGTPALEQLLVTQYLPRLDDIIRDRSHDFAAAASQIRGVLEARTPEWTMPHTSGGISAWIDLGAPLSSALAAAAREHGLTITSGPRFGLDGAFERRIRIPFTNSPANIAAGLDALVDAWESLGGGLMNTPLLDEAVV